MSIKKAIGTQLNFVLEIKLKRYICLANCDWLFGDLCVHFEPFLGWQRACVCHNRKTEKESIYGKCSEYKTSNWHTSDLHHGKEPSKRTFFIKRTLSFRRLMHSFWTFVRMEICIRMPRLKKWRIWNFW